MDNRSSLTRRDLLKRTAGAAAAGVALPTLLPGRVLGANERIRIGFIGLKNRGMQNLRPLVQNAVAVCDVDKNVLAAAKAAVEKANGRCASYSDYRRLLESKDIDAVLISVPDHWHARITVDACEAGKDVYCEKPLTLTIDEGKAMVAAARRTKRIVQTGSQQRSGKEFQKAVELVKAGAIDNIHTIRVGIPGVNMKGPAAPDTTPPPELDYDFWLGPAPYRPYNPNHVHYYFRFFWDYSGGQMTNWGAHHLDIAQMGLGMDHSGPISAEAAARFRQDHLYEVPEEFTVTYRYANGVTLICGCGSGFRGGATFEGNKGSIWVNRGKLEATPAELLSGPTPANNREHDHYRNWLECIKSRRLPVADVAIGHRSATVCHIGNIAIRTGRKVTWDPAKEQITGDAEQAHMQRYGYRRPWVFPE